MLPDEKREVGVVQPRNQADFWGRVRSGAKAIQDLTTRTKVLESLLRANNIQVPPFPTDGHVRQVAESSPFEQQRYEDRPNHFSTTTVKTSTEFSPKGATKQAAEGHGSLSSGQFSDFEHSYLFHSDLDPHLEGTIALVPEDNRWSPHAAVETLYPQHPSAESNDDAGNHLAVDKSTGSSPDIFGALPTGYVDPILDQLSKRVGSLQIAEDGQLRYFGATSNLHILHNGPYSLHRSTIRSISDGGETILKRAGVGQYVDLELEDHLVKLYFTWEDPSIHIIDEEVYFRERARWKDKRQPSPFYSEVLTNAM